MIEDTSLNEGKQRARTAETLSPPGDEKRSRNNETEDDGESIPLLNGSSQFDDTNGSVIITSVQQNRDYDSSDESLDNSLYSPKSDTPLTSTQKLDDAVVSTGVDG